MKNIFKVFLAATVLFVAGCTEPDDAVTADAKEGIRYTSAGSSGALLGRPDTTGLVTFLEVGLDYSLNISSPNVDDFASATIYKSFNGGARVEVETVNALPYNKEFTGITEFLTGLNLTETQLKIGDNITYFAEVTMTNGQVVRDNAANFSVNVSCLSDIGGAWLATSTLYDPNCDGNLVPFPVTITPVAGQPGTYLVNNITDLFFGGDPCRPAAICGFITDVCNDIIVSSGSSENCDLGAQTVGTGSVLNDATRIEMKVTNNFTGEQDIVFER